MRSNPKRRPRSGRPVKDVVDRERIALSSICYDGTNFYTFLDRFNTRCSLAVRGKNKQGRDNLRQVSYALFSPPMVSCRCSTTSTREIATTHGSFRRCWSDFASSSASWPVERWSSPKRR